MTRPSACLAARGLVWAVLTVSHGGEAPAMPMPHPVAASCKDGLRIMVSDARMHQGVLPAHFETVSPESEPAS